MGAYVERNGKKYYKADNGKLYQDYNAAERANMNPLARVTRFAKEKIQQVSNEGAIPVPSFNNGGYSALGYVKSLAGVAGKPFAIQKNPETERFLQKTVDASTKSGNTATFNQDISDKDEYDRLGSNIGNKAFGRYQGEVQSNGDVVVQDDYDTNRSTKWHCDRGRTGKDAEGNDIGLQGRAISAISALHKGLDNIGFTNPRPYGTKVTVGNVNGATTPDSPNYTPKPTTSSNYAPNSPMSTKSTAPSSVPASASYQVQAGDTLTSISRKSGVSIADLSRKNNIQNLDRISIGQNITF